MLLISLGQGFYTQSPFHSFPFSASLSIANDLIFRLLLLNKLFLFVLQTDFIFQLL